ncbi:GNAT family N-acetyltransferase [Caballeronia grimmiae]|uniref:GCN5 family acetyltransferase n=1 Tax=Caballeronia grimmiae TaxID=1071679 RepID=A0A069PED9_9BURK|nr:GNAT family N-acetyltransferase [Caballeronia grimmiae]KDR35671.1 GCN5 family acetyltransferase [Caballeronia grimmiae]GGD83114.1 N-acetyltransferase [Caballeronia grimmiae]
MSAAETSALLYRPFTVDDIPAAHALSLEVKWPHRADDWRFVLDVGAGFIAQDGERVVGTALCWKHGDAGGSLGMVIVAPDSQGKGIGRKLMELLLEALGSRITVLHATPAGEPLYAKLGFRRVGAVHQHQSASFSVPVVNLRPGERIRAIEPGDTAPLVALASRASGFDRSAVLPALLRIAQGVLIEREGQTLGFALIREFGRGHAIGPVVASTAGQEHMRHAQALIAHLLARNEDRFTRIDTPGESGLSDWLAALGLPRVDTVIKMARNGTPPHDESVAQFAIINQGLG